MTNNRTDFNDMQKLHGTEKVKERLENIKSVYPEIIPLLTNKTSEKPYPIDALPAIVRNAVLCHQRYAQQPISLVACSALTQVSIACQGLANVRRDAILCNPISLFFIAIAESGERKSTADKAFGKAARDWENEQEKEYAEQYKFYEGEYAAWESKISGLKQAIKTSKSGSKQADLAGAESELKQLMQKQPQPPRKPILLYEDANQQALVKSLYFNHPSAGVVSDEGGLVSGSQGMNKDNCLNYFATLNKLWDGGSIGRTRVTDQSFSLKGRRVTFSLMMQEAILRKLIAIDNSSSRSSGFLARMLLAHPISTQGDRDYVEPPASLYEMEVFHRRITDLLNMPLPMDEDRLNLAPPELLLSQEAKKIWIDYHNFVERRIRKHSELATIPDFASKSADNAARIAGCFHIFEHGITGNISAETMQKAIAVASWHLSETLSLFEHIDIPQETKDALLMLDWLKVKGLHDTTLSYIRNHCPNSLRSDGKHKKALELLREHGCLLPDEKAVRLNPMAMEGKQWIA